MNRLQANTEILQLLKQLIEAYPDQRFGQLLCNYNVLERDEDSELINPFYTESTETLAALESAVKRYKE